MTITFAIGPVRVMRPMAIVLLACQWGAVVTLLSCFPAGSAAADYLSPCALVSTADGHRLFIACGTARQVLCFDTVKQNVAGAIPVPQSPSGLALSPDGQRLYVTCAGAKSHICIVDVAASKVIASIPVGHTAMDPVLSPDGRWLYVCNQFDNDVSVIKLHDKTTARRIPVSREPVAADVTRDGRYLLVANHLPSGRADVGDIAAVVSVIDLSANRVVKELALPNGSGSLNGIAVSPDGRYAVVTHLLSRYYLLPVQVVYGWMNANAITIIDLAALKIVNTTSLDDYYSGVANPWGVAWSTDSARLVITHAGTHEISIIDFTKLLARLPDYSVILAATRAGAGPGGMLPVNSQTNEIPFLAGSRVRVKLPRGDLGPRAVAIVGSTAYVANYFSDSLSVINLATPERKPASVSLRPKREMDPVRKGEFYFNDASICYQGWQSCASCHPDARADCLNWDLLNDGIGNPKNTKSLLLAYQTPPAMSLGVRATAETAVRAGLRRILFTNQPEEVASCIDEYLKCLKPVPSPYLVRGQLSNAAKRGERLFSKAGCVTCHPPALYTDLQPHDVGTRGQFDKSTDEFYTPTLVEIWRTAPYLHDGSAATIRDMLTTQNRYDQHGRTSHLTHQEIDDLCAYVLSL